MVTSEIVTDVQLNQSDNTQIEAIWRCLENVPDPEIPVISVVDLGIIRNISRDENGHVKVEITPTYSGCPATAIITLDIETALEKMGLQNYSVITRIAPAWTTDWITEKGRDNLKRYGIAPPDHDASCAGSLVTQKKVQCPRCSSENSECVSRFGSTPCKASYRCLDCLEPFDYFKPF